MTTLRYDWTMDNYLGVRVEETINATEPYEDWSRVRSPGRARRRLRYGFRQNVVERRKPAAYMMGAGQDRVLFIHPDLAKQLRDEIKARIDSTFEAQMVRLSGWPFVEPKSPFFNIDGIT